ncbi:unnamed protein product, partial [Lepeophtheirus salmonis]
FTWSGKVLFGLGKRRLTSSSQNSACLVLAIGGIGPSRVKSKRKTKDYRDDMHTCIETILPEQGLKRRDPGGYERHGGSTSTATWGQVPGRILRQHNNAEKKLLNKGVADDIRGVQPIDFFDCSQYYDDDARGMRMMYQAILDFFDCSQYLWGMLQTMQDRGVKNGGCTGQASHPGLLYQSGSYGRSNVKAKEVKESIALKLLAKVNLFCKMGKQETKSLVSSSENYRNPLTISSYTSAWYVDRSLEEELNGDKHSIILLISFNNTVLRTCIINITLFVRSLNCGLKVAGQSEEMLQAEITSLSNSLSFNQQENVKFVDPQVGCVKEKEDLDRKLLRTGRIHEFRRVRELKKVHEINELRLAQDLKKAEESHKSLLVQELKKAEETYELRKSSKKLKRNELHLAQELKKAEETHKSLLVQELKKVEDAHELRIVYELKKAEETHKSLRVQELKEVKELHELRLFKELKKAVEAHKSLRVQEVQKAHDTQELYRIQKLQIVEEVPKSFLVQQLPKAENVCESLRAQELKKAGETYASLRAEVLKRAEKTHKSLRILVERRERL